jgi:hypothetical protein
MVSNGSPALLVARPFVTQGAVDQNEIGWRPDRRQLAGRRHADQKRATGSKQLLGDQHGEGCAHRAAHDPEFDSGLVGAIEICMVASPGRIAARSAILAEPAHEVAVRVEHTDCWHGRICETFLAARLAQEALRRES